MSSCRTTDIKIDGEKWPLPNQPKLNRVQITPKWSGFYLEAEDAEHLADNIDSLKAYIEKLETLLSEIQDYYK